MEELINVSLDSRVDGLTIQNEILTKRSSCVAWVLGILKKAKDILNLPYNILLILDFISINGHKLGTEIFDIKKLLEQRINVTCGCQILESSEVFVDKLDWLNAPFVLFSPRAF